MNEDAWIMTIIYRICSIIPIFTSHSRLILTCFALLPPFLMVLSLDLVSLLKITWVTGVGVQYIVPALLVHASRQKTAMIKGTNHHQSYFKVEATSKWMIFGYDIWIILPIFWPILLFVSVIIINLLSNWLLTCADWRKNFVCGQCSIQAPLNYYSRRCLKQNYKKEKLKHCEKTEEKSRENIWYSEFTMFFSKIQQTNSLQIWFHQNWPQNRPNHLLDLILFETVVCRCDELSSSLAWLEIVFW